MAINVCPEVGGCFFAPVPGAAVDVLLGDEVVASALTNEAGAVAFTSLPAGQFDVVTHWGGLESRPTDLVIDGGSPLTISVRFAEPAHVQ